MSGDNKNSKFNKKHVILPYLIVPIIFVAVSLIIIAPVGKIALNKAVSLVHKAQHSLTISYNDLTVLDAPVEYTKQDDGIVINSPAAAQKIGTIKCENAGLNTDAYYGLNRVSLRSGVALQSDTALFGEDGQVDVYGYASTSFKALKNVQIGDVVTVTTQWGEYQYLVNDIELSADAPSTDGNALVLSTDMDNTAFSSQSDTKLFVVASQISGEAVKEVQ